MSYYVARHAAEISKLHNQIEKLKTTVREQSKKIDHYTFTDKEQNEKIVELEKYLDEHILLAEKYNNCITELKVEILHLEKLK